MMQEKPKKVFRRVQRQRDKEFIPMHDPSIPYKRTFDKTRMSWPLALIMKGRTDILVFVTVLICLGLVGLGLFFYYIVIPALKYIVGVLF